MSAIRTLTPATTPRLSPPAARPASTSSTTAHVITIGQAFEGLAGAVASAGIETVGNTVSSLVQLPRATAQAYKTLYNTQLIGPVLKTAIAVTLPVGIVAAPVLTALGSLGYGLFAGCGRGIEKGVGDAIDGALKDVGSFNSEVAGGLVKAMQQAETEALPEGQKPYDIRVVDAGKGLVGGIAGAAIVGGGLGAVTAFRTPQGVVKAYKEIWNSDQGPVLRVTESLLVPPAAVLAAPLATVGGVVYGLVTGFANGYQKGLGESLHGSVDTVSKFNEGVRDALH